MVRDVCIVSEHPLESSFQRNSRIVSGGSTDNYTRLHHAWGPALAKVIWQFGNASFACLQDFCNSHSIESQFGDRLRLASVPMEIDEMRTASGLLVDAGIESSFQERVSRSLGVQCSKTPVATQIERLNGGLFDVESLLKSLKINRATQTSITGRAKNISSTTGGMKVHLEDGRDISCEMIVLATHLNTGILLPELATSLVSYADQWHSIEYPENVFADNRIGSVFSFNHGYFWGAIESLSKAIVGGGRQFRKDAGIDARVAVFSEKCLKILVDELSSLLGTPTRPQIIGGQAFLECRPCDEIPIIGPMFGESRILIGTGYSGSGATQGFYAGKCLADLIAKGTCPELPSGFHPVRLRSLSN